MECRQRMVNFLSKEIIAEIREAEAKAERIRADGAARAQKLIADERAAGEKLLAATEAETKAEIRENFDRLREATDALLEKNRVEAQGDASEIRKAAQFKMRGAVNEIFRGLDRQCQ